MKHPRTKYRMAWPAIGLSLTIVMATAVACSEQDHGEHAAEQNTPQHHAEHASHDTQATSPSNPGSSTDAVELAGLYFLRVDALTGQPLGDQPIAIVHEDRALHFANQHNADTFRADPDAHLARVNEWIIADQLPDYPLESCVVAGGKLGSMGEPVNHLYRNRLVRFCCAGCLGAFERDPQTYLAKIDQAVIARQKDAYPLDRCVVSGEGLQDHGEPIDLVAGTRLVRLCCGGCVADFAANPAKFLKALDEGKVVEGTQQHTQHEHHH